MKQIRCWVVVALVLVATACDRTGFLDDAFNGHRLPTPLAKPTVTAMRTDGRAFDIARETAGQVTLLYFGYTHCPDICPVQLMHLAEAFRTLGPDTTARIRVLFVTLDPARDTAAVLRDWLRGFHPEFIALRTSRDSVNAMVRALGLAPSPLVPDTTLTVDPAHAAAVVAFSRDGLGHFLYPEGINAAAWAYDLRKLLRDSVP